MRAFAVAPQTHAVHRTRCNAWRGTPKLHPARRGRRDLNANLLNATRRSIIRGAEGLVGGTALVAGLVLAGTVAASTSFLGGPSLVKSGMEKFKQNLVEEAAQDFDRVLVEEPRMRPYLWQRGLALYYLGRFEEAAQQFREDVAVNPNDTEEAIWAFLAEAQLLGPDTARRRFLQVGKDSRSVMRTAYEIFRKGDHPNRLLRLGMEDGGSHDSFYALLYTALWWESVGDEAQAKAAMLAAVATPYGQQSGDYMASLAKVHCMRRGWPL